jgi:hypothetical protein
MVFWDTPFGQGELFGLKRGRALMAQPVTAILSRQGELAAAAWQFTRDTNEANLLVGKVVSRALTHFTEAAADETVVSEMRRELDRLIEQLRRTRHH